jgi:DNA-binding LytR/AlgR family response regulator
MAGKTITAIIVEDDFEAISLLEIYLRAFQEIEIIDKTINPKQGLRMIIKKMPDMVFLDIDMPELNGLEVAQAIKENQLDTEIVFTTAHSKYAYKSLKVEPLDYLIKPFGPEELITVINRYKTKVKRKELERRMDTFLQYNRVNKKLKMVTFSGIVFLNPDEIMLMQADANHTYLHMNNGAVEWITQNISKIIEMIDSQAFVKVNRFSYINLQYLRRIDRKSRMCLLSHQDVTIEEPLSWASISYFEKIDRFPII